jgi:hypothetical protein
MSAALIEAVRAGDPEALAALYSEHGAALYRLAYWLTGTREDAEDVVHEVLVGLPLDVNVIALESAVNSLPDSLRVVIMLKDVEGYSHVEVAELLGISVAASPARSRAWGWTTAVRLPGEPDEPLVLRWARFAVALLLQALPLAAGWRDSAYSVGLIGRAPASSPFSVLDFRVVGSGRVNPPAGRFDCWKVEMRISDQWAITLWASKDRGWLVKTRQGEPDWRTETTLLSTTPPAP